MNQLAFLKQYAQELEDNLQVIKKNRIAIDKTQLVKHLTEMDSSQNLFLIVLVPDLSGRGQSAEQFKFNTATQLWIVKKTGYSEINYDEFYDIFIETLDAAKAVVKDMLSKSLSGCTNLRYLNTASIQIKPVWNESSCNGWRILFDFDSNL